MLAILAATLMAASGVQDFTPKDLEKIEKTLSKSPKDQKSNLLMATYLASTGKWEEALPYLEKLSSSDIKKAIEAEKEYKEDRRPVMAVLAGDAWARTLPRSSFARQVFFDRMNDLYATSFPALDDGSKLNLRAKLYKLYYPMRPGRAFDGRPPGWGGITREDCGVEVTNKIAYDGGCSLRLYAKKPGANIFLQVPPVAVSKGQKVEVSAWVMSDGTNGGGDTLSFIISGADGGRVWMHNDSVHPDLPVWKRIYAEVEAPEGSFKAQLDIRVTSHKGSVYIDGISIKADGVEKMASGIE